jgi:hypothetical protein
MKHLPILVFEGLEGVRKDMKMYRAVKKINPKPMGKNLNSYATLP